MNKLKDIWEVIMGRLSTHELGVAYDNLRRTEASEGRAWKSAHKLERDFKPLRMAIGRILAKVDPQYCRDELDPMRKVESDEIAKQALAKIYSEHKASNSDGC